MQDKDPIPLPIDGILDLHAFQPADIPSVVDEYVSAAHAAGIRQLRLIHGRGHGVQRGIVQQLLDNHPLVAEFFDDADSHLGATIALLIP
ncbi:MAG: Smr/MutS family protein [Vicinamibacterales bacterium]|nr:Smr/MutS family protein [Vicinamibacterales bacterium]